MPKGPKKLSLYKPLNIIESVGGGGGGGGGGGEWERFCQLSKKSKRNQTELEKMRYDAGQRLREQLRALMESENFRIITSGDEECSIQMTQNLQGVLGGVCYCRIQCTKNV